MRTCMKDLLQCVSVSRPVLCDKCKCMKGKCLLTVHWNVVVVGSYTCCHAGRSVPPLLLESRPRSARTPESDRLWLLWPAPAHQPALQPVLQGVVLGERWDAYIQLRSAPQEGACAVPVPGQAHQSRSDRAVDRRATQHDGTIIPTGGRTRSTTRR